MRQILGVPESAWSLPGIWACVRIFHLRPDTPFLHLLHLLLLLYLPLPLTSQARVGGVRKVQGNKAWGWTPGHATVKFPRCIGTVGEGKYIDFLHGIARGVEDCHVESAQKIM